MLEQLQQLVESEMSGQHVHESKSEKVMTIPLPTGQESSPSSQFKEPSTNSLVYADREELVLEGAYEHGMGSFYDAVVTGDIKREEEINTIFEADFPEGPSIRNIVFQTQNFTSVEPAGALDETENLHDSAQVPTSALPPAPPQKPPTGGGEIAAMEPEGDDEQKASKPEAKKSEGSAPTEASTDTELQTLLTDLEPYRANETSSFYFISDPTKAQEVIQKLEAGNVPYGIEFGPGTSVSKLSEIDPGVSVWLAFEPDSQPFERAERTTELYEKMGKLNEPNQIVYLKESLRQQNIRSDIEGLKVVVYRNPDYRYDVPFPDQEFRENRRVVLINDSVHIGEENQYRDFLGWHGISSDQLVFIERNLNNSNWDITEESYVYDSTGALIQSKKEAIEQLLKEARENSTDSSSTETESEQEPADGDNATDRNDI